MNQGAEIFGIGVKIAFSATIDGVQRSLFSVKDNGDSGLLIGQGTPRQMENPYGVKRDFKHQHYSVHPSNNGADTTITQKTLMSDGEEHSAVSFVRNTKQHLLWLVYARRMPILAKTTRVLKRKRYTSVIEIGSIDSAKETLFYSVLVSRPSMDLSILVDSGWEFYTATFGQFMIIVIPMFLQFPTYPDGDVLQFLTSQPILNNVCPPDHQRYESESMPREGLVLFIGIYMDALKKSMMARMADAKLEANFLEICEKAPFCRAI